MKTISVTYIDTTKYTVTLSRDDWDESPLEWTTPAERGATFALKHNRYDLPFEIDNAEDWDEYKSWTEFAESNAPSDQPVYKFVRWYEHSGIAVSLRDDESGRDWDAGIAGVIFGETTEAIEGVFADWKCYVEGDIWNATIETKDGRFIDQLGGLYGDAAVDGYIAETIPGAEFEKEYN